MFREMRRKQQLLSKEETLKILEEASAGVLGVAGDNGYPYTVPLNYVYEDGKIYFHCAKNGHKLDAIRRDSKVSFCVIGQDKVVSERFATDYSSAVCFGRAAVLEEEEKIRHAMELLINKYSFMYQKEGAKEIERTWDVLAVVEVTIDHLSGKRAKKTAEA